MGCPLEQPMTIKHKKLRVILTSWWFKIILVGVVLLLATINNWIDWEKFFTLVSHPLPLCVHFLGISFIVLFICLRWQLLVSALGISIPLLRFVEITLVTGVLGAFSAGSAAGDIAKLVMVSQDSTNKKTELGTTVFVDRIVAMITLLGISFWGVFWIWGKRDRISEKRLGWMLMRRNPGYTLLTRVNPEREQLRPEHAKHLGASGEWRLHGVLQMQLHRDNRVLQIFEGNIRFLHFRLIQKRQDTRR
jgi:hypothetical protein